MTNLNGGSWKLVRMIGSCAQLVVVKESFVSSRETKLWGLKRGHMDPLPPRAVWEAELGALKATSIQCA